MLSSFARHNQECYQVRYALVLKKMYTYTRVTGDLDCIHYTTPPGGEFLFLQFLIFAM